MPVGADAVPLKLHLRSNPLAHAVKNKGLRAAALAATALAFASFGDAFLYPFLPVNYKLAQVEVGWIGIILSINRFVRIFANGILVRVFAIHGLRVVMIAAVLGAVLSTAGYAVASGVLAWVALRIIWGLSFSAMRLGTLGYALADSRQGLALGVSRSLQEIGPLIALVFSPYLLDTFQVREIFGLLALCSLPALWFAWKLPRGGERVKTRAANSFFRIPSTINGITFVSAILIDGILVVILGLLFLKYGDGVSLLEASAFAAFYLAYRRVCLVVLSPAAGWLADRLGLEKVFIVSSSFMILGIILLTFGWISAGAIIVFTFYSLHAAITPGSVAQGNDSTLHGVAENATWRDIGAAAGTLVGGILLAIPSLLTFAMIAGGVCLLVLLIVYTGMMGGLNAQIATGSEEVNRK
jgi:MFS transporter, DHA1 family, multidrug resistance protein